MRKNISVLDRTIRFVVAITVGLLFGFDVIEGTFAYVALTLAVIFC